MQLTRTKMEGIFMSPREVAERFIGYAESQDFGSVFNMLTSDGQYIVTGSTRISRTYNGLADVMQNLAPVFAEFISPPVMKFERPIVDGNRAVLLASGTGMGPYGSYDQPYYAFVTTIEGEGFSQIIEFMNPVMLETALFGSRLVTD